MNIFVLDKNPFKAAMYHCDKHVVRMILETAQILSTVLRKKGINRPDIYNKTHENHPCVLWAEKSFGNFKWLCNLGLGLCNEYTKRYGKNHKCEAIIDSCFKLGNLNNPFQMFEEQEATDFVLVMPEENKTNDPVESYRNYYKGEKSRIAKWKNGKIPPWWTGD